MATTTISDLPRDALVLILRAVIDAASWDAPAGSCPDEIHEELRRVCREWRDAADIAFIEYRGNRASITLREVRDPATLRARFPSLIHALTVDCSGAHQHCRAPTAARAVSSLCASPDLRRVLRDVAFVYMCCTDDAATVVSAVMACSHLTSLKLDWQRRGHSGGARPNMLTPLSQLTALEKLKLSSCWTDAAFPTLPDCQALTSLQLSRLCNGAFAPVGSDASLGRLRSLERNMAVDSGDDRRWASNDPFGLRAALGAGAWRPHLLTRLQKLGITSFVEESGVPVGWQPRVYAGASPAAAVWAPLAPTVTKLSLFSERSIHHDSDLDTGMCAGLGVLTGLQSLVADSRDEPRYPVDFDNVRCPRLTNLLVIGYRGPPIDLARFPRLVHVHVVAEQDASPVALASVAALRRLEALRVRGSSRTRFKPRLNVAQLFGGGRPLAALTELSFERVVLTWDAAAAPGAPSASEFAEDAIDLLQSLRSVNIEDDVLVDASVDEFVLPALDLDGE